MGAFRFRRPPRRRPTPPIDLVAVAVDDALLDALAAASLSGRQPAILGSQDALPGLFAAWQDHLGARRLPESPSVDDARRAVRAAPRRPRSARPVAAVAAAICALLIGSAVVGARSARPGEALWPVTEVVWADQAGSAVAVQDVRGALSAARKALRAGQTQDAAAALADASAGLQRVSDRVEHAAIAEDLNGLLSQLASGSVHPEGSSGRDSARPDNGGSDQGRGALQAGGAPVALPAGSSTASATGSSTGAGGSHGPVDSAVGTSAGPSSAAGGTLLFSSITTSPSATGTGSVSSSSGTGPPAPASTTAPGSSTSGSGSSIAPTTGTSTSTVVDTTTTTTATTPETGSTASTDTAPGSTTPSRTTGPSTGIGSSSTTAPPSTTAAPTTTNP